MRSKLVFAQLAAFVLVSAALGCVEKQDAPPQQQPANTPQATPQNDPAKPKIPKGIPIKKGPGVGGLLGNDEPVVHTAMTNTAPPPPPPAPAPSPAPSGSK